jgi:hypothetical protein
MSQASSPGSAADPYPIFAEEVRMFKISGAAGSFDLYQRDLPVREFLRMAWGD